jgi:hypothetical protein
MDINPAVVAALLVSFVLGGIFVVIVLDRMNNGIK